MRAIGQHRLSYMADTFQLIRKFEYNQIAKAGHYLGDKDDDLRLRNALRIYITSSDNTIENAKHIIHTIPLHLTDWYAMR